MNKSCGVPVLIFLLGVCAHEMSGQVGPAPLNWPSNQSAGSQEDSLRRQQASVEAFRASTQTGGFLDVQQKSVAQQYASVHKRSTAPSAAMMGATAPATRSELPAADTSEVAFFHAPWPASAPLSMPNVQVVGQGCGALQADEVESLVTAAGQKHGVDSALLRSVMRQESAYKPCALSTAGAMGLMQIMPETAETLHLDDPFDAAQNVDAGARFLKMMLDRYQGDVPMALGAYNAGPGRVDKAGGVPQIPETIDYVEKVLGGMPLAY